jgi:hypothetical protein
MVAILNKPSSLRIPVESADTAQSGADRRIFARKELSESVQGYRMDNTVTARKAPQLNLTLRDISIGGLSAISPTPLESGERISVVFPPQSGRVGWDAFGRVIRCEPSVMGYRVALQFDMLQAA